MRQAPSYILRAVFALLLCIVLADTARAGDPHVLGIKNLKLQYNSGEQVSFEAEVQNVYNFPASSFNSFFVITPAADPSKAQRFDLPETTFPPMTTQTLSMAPQYWTPSFTGFHQVEFFCSSPDDIDTTNNYAMASFEVVGGSSLLDRAGVTSLLNTHIAGNLKLDLKLDVAYVAQEPLHDVRISSWNTSEVDFTIDSTDWFAWIETNKYAHYAKANWFLVIDREDSSITTHHATCMPFLDDVPYPGLDGGRAESDIVFGSAITPVAVPSLDVIDVVDTSAQTRRAGAILVTGDHSSGTYRDETFDQDINMLRDNLRHEKLGPQIHPDDIIVLRNPTASEIRAQFQQMKGKYSSVYFMYSGHGGPLSMYVRDFYFYTDLVWDLDALGADSVNIFINGCYSGALVDVLDSLGGALQNSTVTAVTSAAADTSSYFGRIITGTGDTVAVSEYVWAFAKCFGDPAAEQDGLPGISFAEAYEWVKVVDPRLEWADTSLVDVTRPRLFTRSPARGLLNRDEVNTVLQDWYRQQSGFDTSRTLGYLTQTPLHDRILTGYDSSEFSLRLDSLNWLAWLDTDKTADFEKPVIYLTINREDSSITSYNMNWYPILDGIPYPGDTSDAALDIVIGSQVQPVRLDFDHLYDTLTVPPVRKKRCAILVTGGDKDKGPWGQRFNNNINIIRDNLRYEKLGARIHPDDIIVLRNPSPEEVTAEIQRMKDSCSHFYFVYAGHGFNQGYMTLRTRYTYRKLLEDIESINADSVSIAINSCFSGQAVEELKKDPTLLQNSHVTVITSTSEDRLSRNQAIKTGTGETVVVSYWVWAFAQCYGFPDADVDGVPGTSFAETHNWIARVNPKVENGTDSLSNLQRPQLFVRGAVPVDNGDISVRDADFEIRIIASPDSGTLLNYQLWTLDSFLPKEDSIISISPGRMWSFDFARNRSSFRLDLSVRYRDGLDANTPPSGARLGLVRRDSTGAEWKRWYPTLWDRSQGVLRARDVDGFSDWAIAYIRNSAPSFAEARLATSRNTESPPVTPTVSDRDAGDTFTYTIEQQAANGTARIENNALRYMPDQDYSGNDSFTFRATDEAGDWVIGTAAVTVSATNTDPVAVADSVVVVEDTPTLLAVLDNDSDADEDMLIISSVAGGTHASVLIVEDTLLMYDPDPDYFGADTFTYTVSDRRGGSSSASVHVSVLPVNDAPLPFTRLFPIDDSRITGDSAALRWSRSRDVEGDALTYLLTVTAEGQDFTWTTSDTVFMVTRSALGLSSSAHTVTWQVRCTDGMDTVDAGSGTGRFTFDASTGLEPPQALPSGIVILGHHPEPFSTQTSITFALQQPSSLRASVHSVTGQELAVIADGRFAAGRHTLRWDGTSSGQRVLPSGMYLVLLRTPRHAPVLLRVTLLR